MRGVRRPKDIGGVEDACGLGGIEQSVVVITESPRVPFLDLLAGPLPLQGGAGSNDGPSLRPVDIPALVLRDAADLVHGGVHGVLQGNGGGTITHSGNGGHAGGKQG